MPCFSLVRRNPILPFGAVVGGCGRLWTFEILFSPLQQRWPSPVPMPNYHFWSMPPRSAPSLTKEKLTIDSPLPFSQKRWSLINLPLHLPVHALLPSRPLSKQPNLAKLTLRRNRQPAAPGMFVFPIALFLLVTAECTAIDHLTPTLPPISDRPAKRRRIKVVPKYSN